ncbi:MULTISPECIES: hypothetical protein [Streptomycetaceae]|uniref:hypothetical protein n=1 Tax=Streptomycetaceae TaxID=2062 RepID=UPI0009403D24|nr:hypothetical protein [Streptomyces sp. CB02056]
MKTTKKLRHTVLGIAAGMLALVGTVASAGTAHADGPPSAYLNEPGILYRGGHIEAGDTQLVLQNDGNLVLYRAYQDPSLVHAVWQAPKTWGCGYKAIMQGDGNFVVYDVNSHPCWSADTFKPSSLANASLAVSALGGLKVVFVNPSGGRSISWATIRSSDLY